ILVVGAVSILRRAKLNPERYPWVTRLLARRPFKVVAIALANKMARVAWALLARGGAYRAPQLVAAREGAYPTGGGRGVRAFQYPEGVMTTLMRNGRDRRSGKPVKCHARKERVLLVGTRSADHIRASGHSGRIQRPHTWLHPNVSLRCPIFPLHRGRRPYMALTRGRPDRSWMSGPLGHHSNDARGTTITKDPTACPHRRRRS